MPRPAPQVIDRLLDRRRKKLPRDNMAIESMDVNIIQDSDSGLDSGSQFTGGFALRSSATSTAVPGSLVGSAAGGGARPLSASSLAVSEQQLLKHNGLGFGMSHGSAPRSDSARSGEDAQVRRALTTSRASNDEHMLFNALMQTCVNAVIALAHGSLGTILADVCAARPHL